MALSRFVLPFADVGSGIRPSSGAKLFFFETGTSTPADTFNCPDGTTANSNPVIADSKGVFPDIFLGGTFKVILQDKNSVQIWEADPVEFSSISDSDIVTESGTSVVFDYDTLNAAVVSATLSDGQSLNIKERSTGNGGGALWDVVLSSTVTENTFDIVQATGVISLSLVLRVVSPINFTIFGATVDGVDSTNAVEHATSSYPGASFFWPEGVLAVDFIKMESNQSINCGGFGCTLKHNDNATLSLIHSRTPATTIQVTLKNFAIDGNKANQTNVVDAINLDATGMTSPTLARHVLSDLFIQQVKGRGLVHPFPGRDSNYDNVTIYQCDEEGMELLGSDSQFNNMNVGQSGLTGIKANGGSANLISNVKSWFSGRLDTSVGYGIWIRNGTGTQLSNCETQENELHGYFLEGSGSPLLGNNITGCVSNADNKSLTTGNGMRLSNVQDAKIEVKVWASAPLAGVPADGLSIGSGTTGCQIDLHATDFSSFAIDGTEADIGNNEIRLNNRASNVFVETGVSGNKSFNVYLAQTFDWELSGNITVQPTSRIYKGLKLSFWFRQDVTGGRTITFDSQYKINFTPSTGSGDIAIIHFEADGNSNWIQTGTTNI